MKQGSLRLRLIAAGGACILLILAVAGLGLLLLFERHVERRMVVELETHLRQLVSGLERAEDGALRLSQPPAEPRFEEPLSGLYWQLAVQPNGPVLRSRSLWDTALVLPPDRLDGGAVHQHTISGPGGASLLVVEREVSLPESLGGGTIRAAVAVDRSEIHAAGLAFASDLVPSLTLLALFLVTAGWVQVSIGLSPLDAVRRRLSAVRSGRQSRLGEAFPDEVRPLAAEVDHLLDEQEKAIIRARTRAADLAHGLKTPLTVLTSDAEELKRRGEAQLGDEIATVADTIRRHVERELARARAGSRTHLGPPQPLRPVLDRVVDVLQRTPRGHGLRWVVDVAPDLKTIVDPQDLAEIFGNLTENAVQWAKTQVRISGQDQGDAISLSVEDDGPGIPEAEFETALARGGRLDQSKPGTGLGLAIVGDLVEAYGGTLSLRRSHAGGLGVDLTLPRAN